MLKRFANFLKDSDPFISAVHCCMTILVSGVVLVLLTAVLASVLGLSNAVTIWCLIVASFVGPFGALLFLTWYDVI